MPVMKASSDQHIIELFWDRDESAIGVAQSKYDQYLHTIAWNILANDEDCEECKNDAYLALWNSIPPERPEKFKAYAARIIRNIALNKYKEYTRKKRVPSEYTCSLEEISGCLPDNFEVESALNQKRLRDALNQYVSALPKRKRYLFICRYYCGDSVADIARSLGISQSMAFYELSQIRKKLQVELRKEGFEL